MTKLLHILNFAFSSCLKTRFRLTLLLLIPIISLATIILIRFHVRAMTTGVERIQMESTRMVMDYANVIRQNIREVSNRVDVIASLLNDQSRTADYMRSTLEVNKSVRIVTIAYDPDFLAGLKKGLYPDYKLEDPFGLRKTSEIPDLYCPLIFRGQDGHLTPLEAGNRLYEYTDWFHLAHALRRGVWSDPITSPVTKLVLCYYSVPFYHGETLAGVVCIGFDIAEIFAQNKEGEIQRRGDGIFFLLADDGQIFYHSGSFLRTNTWFYTILSKVENKGYFPIWDQIFSGTTGSFRIENPKERFSSFEAGSSIWCVYTPIELGSDWTLVRAFDEKKVVENLRAQVVSAWCYGILGISVLIVFVTLIALYIYNPVMAVSDISREVSAGNLNISVPEKFLHLNNPMGTLATNFNNMIGRLKTSMEREISSQVEAKTMEKELLIARKLQLSLLPEKESFSDSSCFELNACYLPAHHVAGDFYDYWKVNDDVFALLVADVCGKGVPAAMLMAATKSIIRLISKMEHDPGRIIEVVNKAMFEEKGECDYNFTTIFFALYNMKTGTIHFCNAGHCAPVVVDENSCLRWIDHDSNMPIGLMCDAIYGTKETTLSIGETLLLYTDGVTEATNSCQEPFGVHRLGHVLRSYSKGPVSDLIPSIVSEVVEYSGSSLLDDVTMLALKRVDDVA